VPNTLINYLFWKTSIAPITGCSVTSRQDLGIPGAPDRHGKPWISDTSRLTWKRRNPFNDHTDQGTRNGNPGDKKMNEEATNLASSMLCNRSKRIPQLSSSTQGSKPLVKVSPQETPGTPKMKNGSAKQVMEATCFREYQLNSQSPVHGGWGIQNIDQAVQLYQ